MNQMLLWKLSFISLNTPWYVALEVSRAPHTERFPFQIPVLLCPISTSLSSPSPSSAESQEIAVL